MLTRGRPPLCGSARQRTLLLLTSTMKLPSRFMKYFEPFDTCFTGRLLLRSTSVMALLPASALHCESIMIAAAAAAAAAV
jgi:hypothetical protein